MSDKLSEIRYSLKSDVGNQSQARKLARSAANALNPEAAEMQERLEIAFGQIPIADQLRGSSEKARENAVKTLDEAEGQSRKESEARKRRSK